MITKFKIFEGTDYLDEDDLINLFSAEEIEDYYEKNYGYIDVEFAASQINIWALVNNEKVKEQMIEREVESGRKIGEFTREDFIDFIENNESDWYEIEDKTDEDLEQFIEENYYYEFLRYHYEDKWYGMNVREILYSIWGKHSVERDPYFYLKDYIAEIDIIEEYRKIVTFDEKKDFLKNNITFDNELQKKLLQKDPDTVEILFDILPKDSISISYEFQKKFIEYNQKNDPDEPDIIAQAILEIEKRFGLNPEIKKEYADYLYMIDAQKYNL